MLDFTFSEHLLLSLSSIFANLLPSELPTAVEDVVVTHVGEIVHAALSDVLSPSPSS